MKTADAKCRELLQYATDNHLIRINDAAASQDYTNDDGSVDLNIVGDAADEEGRGTGLFHEFGHAIDYAMGEDNYISSTDAFLNALQKDYAEIVQQMSHNPAWADKLQTVILRSPAAYPVSDLIDALSGGSISGAVKHDIEELQSDKYAVCNEAFAHFFETSMGGSETRKKYLFRLFPCAYAEFQKSVIACLGKWHEPKQREREQLQNDDDSR